MVFCFIRVGDRAGIALPYRNQKSPDVFPEGELNALPEKYCRAQVGNTSIDRSR